MHMEKWMKVEAEMYIMEKHMGTYDHVVWHRWHIESNGGDLLGLFSEV